MIYVDQDRYNFLLQMDKILQTHCSMKKQALIQLKTQVSQQKYKEFKNIFDDLYHAQRINCWITCNNSLFKFYFITNLNWIIEIDLQFVEDFIIYNNKKIDYSEFPKIIKYFRENL